MAYEPRALSVERRSIEFVPLSDRYGTPRRLFTIWFSVNLSLLCLTAGTLGVIAGLTFRWALTALALGNALGTIFMAAHSAQGPHLGVPQMIQSRAQFGVLGAALPLLAVVGAATLYTAANGVIVSETLDAMLPLGKYASPIAFGIITLVIAFGGYELIHKMGSILAVLSGAFFVLVAAIVSFHGYSFLTIVTSGGQFRTAAFVATVAQAAAWNLSSAPYVADYSRYLPASVSSSRTFWCTGLGNFLSATLIMGLGAYFASAIPALAMNPGAGITTLFGTWRYPVGILIVVGLLEVNVMNVYSAYMSTVTIVTGIRCMRHISLFVKFSLMFGIICIATVIAVAARDRFEIYFADLLSLLVYVLVPWSAINLADYYFVRKGRYDIDQLYLLDGIYRRYQWNSIGIYALSIALQIPFVTLSFYVGPLARLIGADVAWLPGTAVPTIIYCLAHTRHKHRPVSCALN